MLQRRSNDIQARDFQLDSFEWLRDDALEEGDR
jgi:hypothetical protein